MRPALHDAGRISPYATLLQSKEDSAAFSVSNAQTIVIDAFGSDLGAAPPTATLNAAPLAWNADPARPGVYSATAFVDPGQHRIDGLVDRAALLHAPFDDAAVAPPAASVIPAPGIRAALAQPDADIFQIDTSSPHTYRLPSAASYVLFDLGQVRHGRLIFDVSGPSGTIVDVGWDERLQPGADWILPHPGPLHSEWSQVDSWTLDGTQRSVHTIDARTGRYVVVIAWGGPVMLADVRFEDERYPAVQTGSFSADAQLDAIWQTGVNTARINMVDAYADPWRERAQWWGDAFVVDRVNEVAFADTALLRRGLQAFADGVVDGRPPAFAPNNDGTLLLDYGMLWVQSLDSYLVRSAEEGFVQRIYPKMQDFLRFLAGYRAAGSTLIDVPNLHWSESALIDFPAFYADVGTGGRGTAGLSTPVNAMYYGTLRAAARIAARLGKSADAEQWNLEASQLRTTIHAQLYDAGSGCYASTIYAGIRGIPTVHAQGWALAYDVPPAESRTAVADCLLARVGPDPRAPGFGPYGTYWILEGLANADRTADGLSLVRRLYGAMLDRGATTWWETFDADDRYSSALSHGWGSAPTWFLSTRVLGIARDRTGNLSITPALDVLNYANGSVPIDGGSIDVSWKRLSCEATELTVRLDAPAQLRMPRSANVASAWTERGRVSVESLRGSDDVMSLTLPQGTARFGVTHPCTEPK
jgi:alpha-L-rhamnosidase